jgi:glutathione S-transferase
MKLIGSLTSPFVRKARVVLAEKKIDYEFEIDSPWTPENQVANVNPLGKIPVLVLDDNTVLFDSRVIVEYLDNVAPNNKLMPGPNRERSEVKRWEALADGMCDAAALVFPGKEAARRTARDRMACPPEREDHPQSAVHVRRTWRQHLVHGNAFFSGRCRSWLRPRLSCLPLSRN